MIHLEGVYLMSEYFFTIKTKNANAVNAVLQKQKSVEFDGLNVLADYLELGQIVFIVFGGDKPQWETGLVGIGVISKLPYDYEGRNFKVAVDIKVLFSKPIKRADLVLYPDTYDIIGIAPITKWEPNQALSQVETKKAYALLNAIFLIDDVARKEFENVFSEEQLRRIKGKYRRFIIDAPCVAKNKIFTLTNPSIFKLSNFNSNPLHVCYIRSLLSKPFVILSGNSGTGKTRIATRFAKYLEKKNDSGMTNHLLIPVGADWTDNTKILGYYNPLADNGAGKYEKTDVFRFIERAGANPEIPFFLILDEMNLSHVERYFSDFLSKMELLNYKESSEKVFFDIPGYGKLELPKNLFITGTVNIDETTYMFSPKVLDRANVIEFKPEMDDVLNNLLETSSGDEEKVAEPGVAEGFMQLANDIRSGKSQSEVQPILNDIKPILESFYKELEKCGFEFAYRSVKEIRLYAIAAYKTAEGTKTTATEIADIQILQKILPKIHGNKKQIGSLLDELEKLCDEKSLPNSLAKIRQMKDKLSRFQYASFI